VDKDKHGIMYTS